MIISLAFRFSIVLVMLLGGGVAIFAGHVAFGIIAHAICVVILLAGTLNPNSKLFGPIETHGKDGGIWLTIDDGPDPHDTPAILDLLDQHEAKATFFVIGEKAAQHPELCREIVRRGHQLGNHTWSHPRASFWYYGPVRTAREIIRCQEALKEISGEAPKVFRAPVGHSNVFVHPVLRAFGLRLIGWSSRGFDGVSASLPHVLDRIRASAKEGGIVVVHESTPIAAPVVEGVLLMAKENGWKVTLPDASRQSGSC